MKMKNPKGLGPGRRCVPVYVLRNDLEIIDYQGIGYGTCVFCFILISMIDDTDDLTKRCMYNKCDIGHCAMTFLL